MATFGLNWMLAALMVLTALYHFGHLLIGPATGGLVGGRPDIDLTHGAMGIVMAVMLVGALGPEIDRVWAAVFAVPTAWFLLAAIRRDRMRHLSQFAVCAAMVFMLIVAAGGSAAGVGATSVAMPGMPGMTAGPTGQGMRAIGSVLLVAMAAVTALAVGALLRRPRVLAGPFGSPLMSGVPRLGAGCQLAMNATTVYMLIMVLSEEGIDLAGHR